MIHEIVFSCAGTTRKIADKIAKGFGEEIRVHDLLDRDFNVTVRYILLLAQLPAFIAIDSTNRDNCGTYAERCGMSAN